MLCGFRSQIRGLTLQEARCAIRGKSKHISLQTAKAESEDASMRYNDHNAQETYEYRAEFFDRRPLLEKRKRKDNDKHRPSVG